MNMGVQRGWEINPPGFAHMLPALAKAGRSRRW